MTHEEHIREAWRNGRIVPGYDSSKVRKDEYGAWIVFAEYGNHESGFGWVVDDTLRPIQWENLAAKNADRLAPVVTADGGCNIRMINENGEP